VINRTDMVLKPGEAVMTRVSKFSMVAIAVSLLSLSVSAASANPWQANHPRRAEVNDRLAVQNFRINHGEANGTITPLQAQQLHAEDHAIRTEEKTMAGLNGGHITKSEQRALNQQENKVSKQIGP
jgi:hypothetical protein